MSLVQKLLALIVLVALLAPARAAPPPGAPGAPSLIIPVQSRRLNEALMNQARALVHRANQLNDAGHPNEALEPIDQALALARQAGVDERALAGWKAFKANYLIELGRYGEAETILLEAINTIEAYLPRGSDLTAEFRAMLGQLYMKQGRWDAAEAMLVRSVEQSPRGGPSNEFLRLARINSLAGVYIQTGRYAQAQPLLQQALTFYQQAPQHFTDEIAATLGNLAMIDQEVGFQSNDADLLNRALQEDEQAYQAFLRHYGPDDPSTMINLSNKATLLGRLGRFDEAAPALETILDVTARKFGADNVRTAHAANNLAWVELGQKDVAKAMPHFRTALAAYLKQRTLQRRGPNARGFAVDEREVGRTILGLLSAARALADADPAKAAALANEAFIAAQSVHSAKAAEALALTTARFSAGDGALAVLIRQRQDLADRRKALDDALTASLSQPAQNRNRDAEQAARNELANIEAQVTTLDASIAAKFPNYAALADAQPLSIEEARAALRPEEALVLIAPFGDANGEGGFTFIVRRDGAFWRATDVGRTQMTQWVQTLRCGLDQDQWSDDNGHARCAALTGVADPGRGAPPYAAGVAYQLFNALFGDLAPKLKGKTLLIAAGDPLSSVPFQVLATQKPAEDFPNAQGLAQVAWLGRSNPVAVLPSVAGLRGLRSVGASAAPEPFLGFGDPTLVGDRRCGHAPVPKSCPRAHVASADFAPARGVARIEAAARSGDGLANLDEVRSLCPLPETAMELHCVAESVNAPESAVKIGADATLGTLRATPLDRYRIIHFATHGLLAGDMETATGSVAEPALVLTPPDAPAPNDDGLLRASEIATLKLNADWVILSACNTAAGASLGGEAMSGLASAFLYAGARSLLVSHWSVRSDAAVLLTTTALSAIGADRTLSRAEAMRRSEVALIDDPSLFFVHPSVWAPFSLVGEAGPVAR
jgi:CHAT domain-containing protein/tetratricopeptide (TPR) repeat protein